MMLSADSLIKAILALLLAIAALITGMAVVLAGVSAATIRVPQDQPTIQAGIDAAQDGDLVLVSPGVYTEQLSLSGKTITLASQFYATGDEQYIDSTIIDGHNGPVITVHQSAGPDTRVIGFTIRNGNDGIKAFGKLHILNNHFVHNGDAIDYTGGGGISRDNRFENNRDDAIDFDGPTEATIEDNIIRNNGDDGIEIRLHPYQGPTLDIVIRNNTISGNAEDGIQLIDYPGVSDRVFRIERNRIMSNAMVGLGLMDNGVSKEDFQAANIPERIHLFNNTFVDNPYAVTGGDNLIALNNLFVNAAVLALKNVDAGSIAAYNLFWNNGAHHQGSNIDTSTTRFADPLLSTDYRLQAGSPAIDAGTAHFEWNGETVLDLPTSAYMGTAPDLGRYETAASSVHLPIVMKSDPVLVGAGDIAACSDGGDEATASLLDGIDGTVFTLGDNVYPDGTPAQFEDCYGPTWGRHKDRTRPSPGNHDYHTSGAAGYFNYFGAAAGDPAKGYYSYDLGAWHIVVLNSNISVSAGSPQEQWLRADLAAHPAACTLAYWHHPRFSSGLHGSLPSMQPLWEALYDVGADVVLNGHDHDYERFAPQDPNGVADPERGIREFVAGTGGKSHYVILTPIANSQVRNADAFGLLKLTLHPTSYDWEFIPEAGKTFTDSGSASCVLASSPSPAPASRPLVDLDTPIANPQPPSTLLPPGTTALSLTVQSSEDTTCAWSRGVALPYDAMAPFAQGAGTTLHRTTLRNLDPDPNVVNKVYVRCASQPDYLLQLKYRSLSRVNPAYPRTGNLWGWWDLFDKGLPYMARIDLWLGAAHATAGDIRELRRLNPDIRILTNINAVDNANLPDDYYLKDIQGNRFEVWPNSYRLNLTKPYVAEYQARYAYQRLMDNDLMFDGVFFDNVFTTQSWRKYDVYGNRFLVDADENGVEDDPAALDAAWKAGVFHELETFRALMPHAMMLGHSMDIYEPGIAEIFNGISLGFQTADVLESEMIFADLWNEYHAWNAMARRPIGIMIESSPPDQIAYGYDYSPWDKIPPSTLEFARSYYPYVRFGLALTLMNDGYFAHEFGDTWHGNDWWYDELDFELGYPLGPAERVDLGTPPGENQIINGGFEAAISDPWRFLVNESEGNGAILSRDTTEKAVGAASARTDVIAASGVSRHIKLVQLDRSLEQGVIYDVTFWAKSDTRRTITVSAQKGSPDWRGYGLLQHVPVDTDWKKYTVSFAATETTHDAHIQFLLAETSGTVWLDDVSMRVRPPDVYRRKFTNGMVLLNGSKASQEITLGPGYRRLQGQQAPRTETILDDGEAAFSTTGAWTSVTYDSGELQATGPFYHCWQGTCHERSGSQGEARWDLEIQAADTYTITAWWPAAPQADTWNQSVTYEVVAGEHVVASKTFDQRSGGDEWHFVAEVRLSPDNVNAVRMRCQGEAPCLADALHLRSQARYNDGSSADQVTLQPLDGIVLARLKGPDVYLPVVSRR